MKKTTASRVELEPRVAIVTPAHNSEATLRRTLDSIQSQNYHNYIVFVVDDHSTDNTAIIAQEFQNRDPRFRVIRPDGGGCVIARNFALQAIFDDNHFDYIAFLDSDDYWLPNKLKSQVTFMSQNRLKFSYGDYKIVSKNGDIKKYRKAPHKMSYFRMLLGCSVGCLTVMYSTADVSNIRMPHLAKRNDFALWCLILKRFKYGAKYPGLYAVYDRGKNGLSSGRKSKLIKYHYQLHRRINGFNPALAAFFTLANICNYLLNIAILERKIK